MTKKNRGKPAVAKAKPINLTAYKKDATKRVKQSDGRTPCVMCMYTWCYYSRIDTQQPLDGCLLWKREQVG